MPKTLLEKEQFIDKLLEKLARRKSLILLNYQGLKVFESEELRNKLRENNRDFLISKNSLLKIVLNKEGLKIDDAILDQPLGLAFSYDDEVAICKDLTLFASEHEALEILGGILADGFVSPEIIARLAKLPSREELLTKLVGSLNAPLSGLVNVLTGNIRGLVNVLNQIKEQR